MLLPPDFSLQIVDLGVIFASFVSFGVLVWASRKLVYFVEISDFAIAMSIKKDERIAKARRQRGKIKNSFFKVKVSKQELNRRKKLYKTKQDRANKMRSKTGRVISSQKKSSVNKSHLVKRIPSVYDRKTSSSSKRTDRREFMTEKYRKYEEMGFFKTN
jgi:hypothetical protein